MTSKEYFYYHIFSELTINWAKRMFYEKSNIL